MGEGVPSDGSGGSVGSARGPLGVGHTLGLGRVRWTPVGPRMDTPLSAHEPTGVPLGVRQGPPGGSLGSPRGTGWVLDWTQPRPRTDTPLSAIGPTPVLEWTPRVLERTHRVPPPPCHRYPLPILLDKLALRRTGDGL